FLQVLTDPWATIHIDGTIAGTTPLSGPIAVRPGSHVVRAANPFFAEKATEVAVARGDTARVEIGLREGTER
ncbi:MAG: PEGA domain-containing protein, partial [Candidatus Eisenbacteria bacterium]|nr:PEGA domain-containing protein [Candidatus Eisenbacteria bacterium]